MLERILILFIDAILLVSSSMYIWKQVRPKNINYYSIVNLIFFIACCSLVALNDYYDNNILKPFIASIIILIYCCIFYRNKSKEYVIMPIYSQIIILFSELIFACVILLIKHVNESIIKDEYFDNIIPNIIIALIAVIMCKFKFINKLYYKILNATDKIKNRKIIIYSFFVVFIADILTAFIYYKVNLIFLLVTNTAIIVIYMIFVFVYLKTDNNYLKVYDKYNMTLNSLKEYEDILSRYRISNHENKNQLLTIRSMVKNKKVASYIDEIVENKIKDNEKLMFDSMVIPEGGLRGLIYSKMLLMKENNIEFDLCVDKALKTTDLTVISDDLMFNICSIVGVYLDNAIEAVKELDEKYITIEIYLDDTLNIAITNNYEGNIDLDSIDKVGYSTKGGSHGYGLSLVKEIISNNKNISNSRRISDDEFTQEIKIKYKK